ncbi:MAG: hypothetical protein ACYTGQ_09285 [Planctomycetota bacterium]|jgi:hypothetical protein
MDQTLMEYGVAGLMGALWVWERSHSQRRERQLSEAHDRLMARDRQLEALMELVRQNTRALVGFERGHRRMLEVLARLGKRMGRRGSRSGG